MGGTKLLVTKTIEAEEGTVEAEEIVEEDEENTKIKEEATKIITLTFSDKQTRRINNRISTRKNT